MLEVEIDVLDKTIVWRPATARALPHAASWC
jgi:hypothetical protein